MSDIANRDASGSGQPSADSTDHRIRLALCRLEAAVERKPGFGHSTGTTTTTLMNGLRCISREGEHVVVADLGPALGGNDTGPTPSTLLRAALGSCLAMGYRLQAARHGIAVAGIRVAIETDAAIEGLLDPDSELPPGFTEIRYRVEIDSQAPSEAVERLIAEADRLSPLLDAVTRVNRVERLSAASSSGAGGS